MMSGRAKAILGGVLVAAVSLAVFAGVFFATRTITTNTDAIDAIEQDRTERLAARCVADHRSTVALLSLTQLMNAILDAAANPNAPPAEQERRRAFRAQTDRLISDAESLIRANDCDPKGHP